MTPPPLKKPAGSSTPTPPHRPVPGTPGPRRNSNRTWLIVGCSLAGLLLIVAVLLYFLTDMFTSDAEDYDDGATHEKVLTSDDNVRELQETPLLAPETKVEADSTMTTQGTARLHGLGTNGHGSFSLELDITPDGTVTGTYWNIFGNLRFTVAGHRLSNGTLDMELTCTDGVQTHMALSSSDGYNYSGTWGKKGQPVGVSLYDGPFPDVSYTTVYNGHIQGGILNRDFCISEYNGKSYFWYPSQGFANRLPVQIFPNGFKLYGVDGNWVGTCSLDNNGEGSLSMQDGQSFNISLDAV